MLQDKYRVLYRIRRDTLCTTPLCILQRVVAQRDWFQKSLLLKGPQFLIGMPSSYSVLVLRYVWWCHTNIPPLYCAIYGGVTHLFHHCAELTNQRDEQQTLKCLHSLNAIGLMNIRHRGGALNATRQV